MDLSRKNVRSINFYDFKCNLTAKQSLARFLTAFGDKAPCKATICRFQSVADFKRSRVNLSDVFRDGGPFAVVNNKNIDAVHRMIETDRHVTYHEIWAFLDIGVRPIQ
ncbi:hypothetical protein EVAR_3927_1 [Eumeta japonica]|uniref:Mos1 transposase HTH domain-containing protein n=1 Tax=Eumeta variegata TaxID=151549 RepID=A0A4C1SRN7_EUMVA|nr:hypothetical protein EVAR_3927_1 [Eumeta japonica]